MNAACTSCRTSFLGSRILSPPTLKYDTGDIQSRSVVVVDEQLRSEGKAGTAGVAEDTEPCVEDGVRNREQARREAPSAVDEALHSIMAATQDSFREQLANMRDNLNKAS